MGALIIGARTRTPNDRLSVEGKVLPICDYTSFEMESYVTSVTPSVSPDTISISNINVAESVKQALDLFTNESNTGKNPNVTSICLAQNLFHDILLFSILCCCCCCVDKHLLFFTLSQAIQFQVPAIEYVIAANGSGITVSVFQGEQLFGNSDALDNVSTVRSERSHH